jgi:hypothetical protein
MLGGARLAAILDKGGDVRRGIAAFAFWAGRHFELRTENWQLSGHTPPITDH